MSHRNGKCENKKCARGCDTKVCILGQKKLQKEVIIRKPGRYCFFENAIWNPQTGGDCNFPAAGITIASNNVTIDLNGYTYSQQTNVNGQPLVQFAVGIKINPGVQNVIIRNGTMEKFASYGIYAKATVGNDISTLLIEDMTMRFCGLNSSVSDGLQLAPCGNILFFGNGAGCIGLFGTVNELGAQAAFLKKFVIRNCRLLEYGVVTGADNDGIRLTCSVNGLIENCIIKGTSPDVVTVSAGVGGIENIFGKDLIIKDCEISDINAANFYATGIALLFVFQSQVINTTITEVFQTGVLVPSLLGGAVTVVNATGIKMLTCPNSKIQNCVVNDVTSELTVNDVGFSSGAQAVLITESANCLVENCTLFNTNYNGNVGFAAGITTSSNNSVFKNNQINNVKSDTGQNWGIRVEQYNQGGFFFPVPFVPVFGNVFELCVIENVGNFSLSNVNQGGLLIRNDGGFVNENNIVQNCIMRGNIGHGILIDGAQSQNNIVQNNKLSKNTLDGINDSTGLSSNKNVYIGNEAYKNGANNYVGFSNATGVPISVWNLSGNSLPFSSSAAPFTNRFDNLDIL